MYGRHTFRCTTAHQCSSERTWIDIGTECSNHTTRVVGIYIYIYIKNKLSTQGFQRFGGLRNDKNLVLRVYFWWIYILNKWTAFCNRTGTECSIHLVYIKTTDVSINGWVGKLTLSLPLTSEKFRASRYHIHI